MDVTYKNWSSDDDRQLALLVESGANWHDIGGAIGRTWRACVSRARLIGLDARGSYGKPMPWSDADIVKLHTLWLDGNSDTAIGKAMGRDAKSVNCKRRHLGMTRTPKQGLATARGIISDARAGFPVASPVDRKRGEALLTLAFGGHKGFDASAINAFRPAHLPDMHQPRGSSTAWCAE